MKAWAPEGGLLLHVFSGLVITLAFGEAGICLGEPAVTPHSSRYYNWTWRRWPLQHECFPWRTAHVININSYTHKAEWGSCLTLNPRQLFGFLQLGQRKSLIILKSVTTRDDMRSSSGIIWYARSLLSNNKDRWVLPLVVLCALRHYL